MSNHKKSIIRLLFLLCLCASIFATYYSTMVLQNYEVLQNEDGVPDLEINYDV